MKEFKRMLWMMLGVVVGFAAGLYVLVLVFGRWPHLGDSSVALFVSVPILGGGLVGGGYLAQWLLLRYDRAQRQRKQAEKGKSGPRKKKK